MNANCTSEIMEHVVNGSLAVVPSGFFPLGNDSAYTTSGTVRAKNFVVIDICSLPVSSRMSMTDVLTTLQHTRT